MNKNFSAAEFKDRLKRTREVMEAHGLDALFLTEECNFRYYTGSAFPYAGTEGYNKKFWYGIYIPLQGDVIGVEPDKSASIFSDCAIIDDNISFPDEEKALMVLLRDNTKVGMEIGTEQRLSMPVTVLERLVGGETAIVDSSPVTSEVRALKSTKEIGFIRKACEATAEAFRKTFANMQAGLTEREVDALFKASVISCGADNMVFANSRIFPGGLLGGKQPSRRTGAGDYVWMDAGGIVNGYRAEFSRAITIGKPTEDQLKSWKIIRDATRNCISLVKPGVKVSDLCKSVEEELLQFDIPPKAAGRIGHGIGLDTSEIPSVANWDDTVLKPGMVFTIEPGHLALHGYYVIEAIVAVTAGGGDVLSDCSSDELAYIETT